MHSAIKEEMKILLLKSMINGSPHWATEEIYVWHNDGCAVNIRQEPRSCSLDLLCCRFPVPRQQFRQARDRQVGYPGDNIGKPCLRVDAVHFG